MRIKLLMAVLVLAGGVVTDAAEPAHKKLIATAGIRRRRRSCVPTSAMMEKRPFDGVVL